MRTFLSILVLLGSLALQTAPSVAAELVMFESIGCTWCERWHREVGVIYKDTKEGRILPLRLVDVDDDLPEDLVHVKGVFFTPTFVVMDGQAELGRIRGYPGEDFFWPMLGEFITQHSLVAPATNAATNTSDAPIRLCATNVC